MSKRILITLSDDVYEILKSIKGLGTKDSEKIRNIVIAWLSEKSYIKKANE